MNISFDLFNEHPELKKGLSTEEHVFYTEYLKFFERKLLPLREEIDKEENEDEDGARFTEIHVLHSEYGRPATFYGYSQSLKSRMIGMFSNNDFEEFKLDLENRQRGFHN